jgi:hypothetical protein
MNATVSGGEEDPLLYIIQFLIGLIMIPITFILQGPGGLPPPGHPLWNGILQNREGVRVPRRG